MSTDLHFYAALSLVFSSFSPTHRAPPSLLLLLQHPSLAEDVSEHWHSFIILLCVHLYFKTGSQSVVQMKVQQHNVT